jgi:hypothetical protein
MMGKKILPLLMMLMTLWVIPAPTWAGGQNETPAQQKERENQERAQQQKQLQQQRQQQLQQQRQQQQQQAQQRQQQVRQQQQQLQQQRQQQQQQRQQQQEQLRQQQQQQRGQQLGRQQNPGQQLQQRPGQRGGQAPGTPRVLSPQESQQHVQQWNQNRSQLGGINRRPLPAGQVSALPNGHEVIQTSRGSQVEVRPNGAVARVKLPDGRAATFQPNGQVRTIQTPGLRIDRGLHGERRIESDRNGQRLVSEGPNRGFLERPYVNRYGRAYVQRTYWVDGRPQASVYRTVDYGGIRFYRYTPVYYYHPAFYFYAYRPWRMRVTYDWGWNREPWHDYYGVYFRPEPFYASPVMWLTDFILMENLRLAYQARMDAQAQADYQADQQNPPDNGYPPSSQLSPEMKQAVSAEVQRQLDEERAAAQQPAAPQGYTPPDNPAAPPEALDPSHRLFVVSTNLTVSTSDGQECDLTGGDVITRLDDTPGDDGKVRVSVMTSKEQDCAVGVTPLVGVSDLQEMHNDFNQQVDSGMQNLASQQGQSGIPPAGDVTTTPGEVPPPVPDGAVDQQLQAQQAQATQTETQVESDIQADQGGGSF